jgi:hypothetical protein
MLFDEATQVDDDNVYFEKKISSPANPETNHILGASGKYLFLNTKMMFLLIFAILNQVP